MSTVEISSENRLVAPYAQIGLIVSYWGTGGATSGTFSIVGQNDVLTATHLVYDPDKGGKPTSVELYIAADYNQTTDRFDDEGTKISVNVDNIQYQDQVYTDRNNELLTSYESSYDVAVIGLDTSIGDTYGYLKLNPFITQLDNFQVLAVGYPVDGTGMMQGSVTPSMDSNIWITNTEDLKPGNSGGPLLVAQNVIGVASAAGSDTSHWAAVSANFEFILTQAALNDTLLGANAKTTVYDFTDAASDVNQTFNGFNVNEIFDGAGGDDTVRGFSGNDSMNGGSGNDSLLGGEGNDTLVGGAGNDKLYGETGDDVYYVTDKLDKVYENKNEGIDEVVSDIAWTLGTNLENLTLSGNSNINAVGNSLSNDLLGNHGNNKLSGGSGNDTLDGGAGNDTLSGGTGNDVFCIHRSVDGINNIDRIQDFARTQDKIQLSLTEFDALLDHGSSLSVDTFFVGKLAQTNVAQFVYDKPKGILYYDADGLGSEAMLQVAIIGNKATLSYTDFITLT
jgi:Ca2+-binding RTX toxin-like protein